MICTVYHASVGSIPFISSLLCDFVPPCNFLKSALNQFYKFCNCIARDTTLIVSLPSNGGWKMNRNSVKSEATDPLIYKKLAATHVDILSKCECFVFVSFYPCLLHRPLPPSIRLDYIYRYNHFSTWQQYYQNLWSTPCVYLHRYRNWSWAET